MSILANSAIQGSGIDVGDIQNSLRFRGAQYLSKTFGTPTANTSWALSCWVKRGALAVGGILGNTDGLSGLSFHGTDAIRLYDNVGAQATISTSLYRDPTAHGHLFVRSNGTNIKGYWNSVEVFSYTGTITNLNKATTYYLGRYSSSYFDGYNSRVCFVDNGGTLTPNDFGYLNTEINEWVSKSQSAVKAVVDAGGTNSFMLDFDSSSLGNDFSSKNNDWASTGHSTTAGTTCDWPCRDVPGNSFATLNTVDKSGASVTKNGNLVFNPTDGTLYFNTIRASIDCNKSYWEMVIPTTLTYVNIGLMRTDQTLEKSATKALGEAAIPDSVSYRCSNGDIYVNGSAVVTDSTPTAGDVLQFAYDSTTGKVWVGRNNTWMNSGDPSAGTGQVTTVSTSYKWCPAISDASTQDIYAAFGQIPLHASATYQSAAGGYFRYAPPTGFKALCQANLPDPTVVPSDYVKAKTYTGNGSTQTITGIGFQPDLIMFLPNANATVAQWCDSTRGVTKLKEVKAVVETTDVNGVTSFNADGFSLGTQATVNGNAAVFTALCVKKKTGFFDIVQFTGNATNRTVAHSLGAEPDVMLFIPTNAANESSLYVRERGNLAVQYFSTSYAEVSAASNFQSTHPSSSVITLGNSALTNFTGTNYTVYLFKNVPGLFHSGVYTGNGSTDGAFSYTGMQPAIHWQRCATIQGQCYIWDNANATYNATNKYHETSLYVGLYTTSRDIDFVSNGVKYRSAVTGEINYTSEPYVYFTFGSIPTKYSNAR